MQKYIKIYVDYFDYGIDDFIPCEACGRKSADIHHIKYKSRGGKDEISNLMALCRRHHDMAHNEIVKESELQFIHNSYLSGQRKIFLK